VNVLVGRQNAQADKTGGSENRGTVVGVSNDLSIVVHQKSTANKISTRREIHDGTGSGRRAAFVIATVALRDGPINGCRIIGDSVTNSTKILYIPKHL